VTSAPTPPTGCGRCFAVAPPKGRSRSGSSPKRRSADYLRRSVVITRLLNVKVPNLLSLLAYDRPNAPVRGLDTFPKADRTPLAWATRLAFIGMVGIGTGLVLLSLWYWLRRRRNGPGPEDRLTLIALAGAGPLAFLANELGWLVSEFGPKPWVVYGVFRTSSAITTAPGLGATFTGFTLLYIGLSALTVWGVRRVSTGTPELSPSAIVSVA
jgi:cytochrome bd ubiquinol oxidase subunit I